MSGFILKIQLLNLIHDLINQHNKFSHKNNKNGNFLKMQAMQKISRIIFKDAGLKDNFKEIF